VVGSYFSPEDGDSMFLGNVGIYLRVYTAPKPRTTKTTSWMHVYSFSRKIIILNE
jgi:hypothetical protein